MLDVWILADPTEFAALATEESPFSYTHSQAITGYWATDVFNVVGLESQVQEIIDALPTTPVVYAWRQGDGTDSLDVWPTDPAPILALMKDHVTYDSEGVQTGTTPATQENPNWGHVFYGQSTRIFAGAFDKSFSGAFR
jgi:hypothetical protein